MRARAIARPRPRPSVFSFALRGLLLLARGGLGREDELLPRGSRNLPGNPLPCTSTNTSCVQKTGVPIRFDAETGKNANFLRHQYQSWEVDNFRLWRGIFQRNLRKNDTVVATVDIGAWVGTTAIWLAAHSDFTVAFLRTE
eukprot:g4131.t1